MIEVDVIGVLTEPSAEEGGEAIVHPGWHVNITTAGLAARPDLAAFVVTPSWLRREWSRRPEDPQITVALRFDSEAEAEAALGL